MRARANRCDSGAIPADAAVAFGRIIVGNLIGYLDIGLERDEGVTEADRNVQLLTAIGGQLGGNMVSIGR